MTIGCEVTAGTGGLTVSLAGRLGLRDVPPLRERLLMCLAEQPEALLLDLSALHVEQPPALTVFTALASQAARWPGTPVLLCTGSEEMWTLIAGLEQQIRLFTGLEHAREHLRGEGRAMPSHSEELLPVAGATRHARDVATEACLRWGLPDLTAPASLIVNELVANAIDHAGTMMTLRLSLRDRFLDIGVRDGSPARPPAPKPVPPEAAGGRGLLLVDALAYAWGCLPSADGKVMWAALHR
ncbi:ATP-binding protein [Actinoplanes sp. NPDC051851]|uniref:ATP-binding protein n=1 Tax=Actinoplanes sp. NPDC051851 TaxID=3154753 RepID=UPI00342B8424